MWRLAAVAAVLALVGCSERGARLDQGGGSSAGALHDEPAPRIDALTPASGQAGDTIVVSGAALDTATVVRFPNSTLFDFHAAVQATFTIQSGGALSVVVPAGTISGPILVSTPNGTTWSRRFTIQGSAVPTISSFAPTRAGPGILVRVMGTGFTGTSSVRVGSLEAAGFLLRGGNELSFVVPEGAVTDVIRIENSVGGVASASTLEIVAAPLLTDIVPGAGVAGDTITLSGSGLMFATRVELPTGYSSDPAVAAGPVAIASVTVVSDTEVTFTVPGGCVSGALSLVTSGGRASLPFTVQSTSAPTLTDVAPASGTPGAEVYLTGSGFTGAQAVAFNGTPASYFVVDTDTLMLAVVPQGATSGAVAVTNSAATVYSSSPFTVPAPPITYGIDPMMGDVGTTVTLTGSGFTGTTSVRFPAGADAAGPASLEAAFTTVDDSTLSVVVPDLAVSGPLTVITFSGSTDSPPFSIVTGVPPLITGFSPASEVTGAAVLIDGSGFLGTTGVDFDNTMAAYRILSDTQLEAFVPYGVGTGPVRVSNAVGTDLSAQSFTRLRALITSFAPTQGAAGEVVSISGRGFSGTQRVMFGGQGPGMGGVDATFRVVADSELVAMVPPGASTGEIFVLSSGDYTLSSGSFTVLASSPPSIVSFTPSAAGRGSPVTLFGSGFTGASSVRFGDVEANFQLVSDTELTTFVPEAAGSGPLRVVNALGTAVSTESFTVLPPPTISAIAPTSAAPGDTVTLTGTGFTGTSQVFFGAGAFMGGNATFTVDSDTQLRAIVPADAHNGSIRIFAPGGSAESAATFTVLASALPTIAYFDPLEAGPGRSVTLFGSGFTGTTAVAFAGTSASFSWQSDAVLYTTVPEGAVSGPLTVTNNLGSVTSATEFVVLPPPTITSFAPTSGAPGDTFELYGTGFTYVSSVFLGAGGMSSGASALFTMVDDGHLTVTVPSGVGSGPVRVMGNNGSATSSASFTIESSMAPTLYGFAPEGGRAGDYIGIQGAGFTGTTSVRFNGADAQFNVMGDGFLTAMVPTSATTGYISVVNTVGTGSSTTVFTIYADPLITSLDPTHGPPGTMVTITGSGLSGAQSVSFAGDAPAASFQVLSDTEILAEVPTGAASGQVRVATPGGTTWSMQSFTVDASAAPAISSFVPTSGGAGTQIVIQGSGFTGTTGVEVGGSITEFAVMSDTQLSAWVPLGAVSGPITVRNALGSSTSTESFTIVPPPTITSFAPGSGAPGDEVVLTGTGFTGVQAVGIGEGDLAGSGSATSFVVDSETQITLTVPSGASSGQIFVFTNHGSARTQATFVVTAATAPSLTSFTPASAGRGMGVRLFGSGFTGTTSVSFDGVSAQFYLVSDTELQAFVPMTATSGPITVTNTLGSVVSSQSFTVLLPPVVSSFAPSSGSPGTEVTLSGSGFAQATGVFFGAGGGGAEPMPPDAGGGGSATFTIVSDSEIVVVVPPGAASGRIAVRSPGGMGESSAVFTVQSSAPPSVSSFSPPRGGIGAMVTVYGANFTGTTAVRFGGTSTTDVEVAEDGILYTRVPSGASSGPLTVVNTLGEASSSAAFEVMPPPTLSGFAPSSGAPGDTVTITGTGFSDTSAVAFAGAWSEPTSSGGSFTVVSDTELIATVPLGASSGPLAVMTPWGRVESVTSFLVESAAAPSITAFTPTAARVGSEVMIGGSGFTGTLSVAFNGASSSFELLGDGGLRAVVPEGATSGPITVTNTAGSATTSTSFTVLAPPTITGFSPASGGPSTEVTITGTGFTVATHVSFAFREASFFIVSDTELHAYVPSGAMSGPIEVDGVRSAQSFTVTSNGPPVIIDFQPASGAPNTFTRIYGGNFTGVTAVSFNGVPSMGMGVESDSQLIAYVPQGATSGPITVTNSVGSVTSTESFTVLAPPTITSFSPPSGAPGDSVTVFGTGFAGVGSVSFGGAGAGFEILDDGTLIATVPGGAQSGPIELNYSVQSAQSFTVESVEMPTLTGFSPARGGAGTMVQIFGRGFTGITALTFNGVAATHFFAESDNLVHAVVPRDAGSGPIAITNTLGTATSATPFEVIPAPVITALSPSSGEVGTSVTVSGTGLATVDEVRFGGIAAATVTVVDDTELLAEVPSGATTDYLYVSGPGGEGRSLEPFTVLSSVAPTLDAFAPDRGGVGTDVSLLGSGFTGVTAVSFNGLASPSVWVASDSELVARVPAGATSGPITVTNTVGSATSTASFTVLPPPAVTGLAPASGAPGTTVTIDGGDFTDASAVTFGGVAATFSVISATQLSAVVPATAVTGPVRVTTPGGTTASAADFVVLSAAAPTLSAFDPIAAGAGRRVRIYGSGFAGATSVSFNGVAAGSLDVVSDSQLVVLVPAGAASGPLSVTNNVGTATSSASFTFVPPPTLTSFTPASGPQGTSVTITGTDFVDVRNVGFGAFGGASASFTVTSPTELVAIVPPGATSGPISLVTTGGEVSSSAAFTVESAAAPTVTSFAPASGGTGTIVVVSGSGFTGLSGVSFGGTPATLFTADSDTELMAAVPPGATTGPITVSNSVGSASSSLEFVVGGGVAPTITAVTPPGAPAGGSITITGTNFVGDVAVMFSGQSGGSGSSGGGGPGGGGSGGSLGGTEIVSRSSTELVVIVPPDARTGFVLVLADGGMAIAPFFVGAAPVIDALVPDHAPVGATIELQGSGFAAASAVAFAGTAASFTIVDDQTLTAVVPEGAASGAVTVANPAGTGSASFTVDPPPQLASVTPIVGPTAGGSVVVVAGQDLVSGASLTVGGLAATDVVVSADGQTLTAVTPPHAAGLVDLEVVNPDGQRASLTAAFRYVPPPALASLSPVRGPVSGGTSVTLSGADFEDGAVVLFGGLPAQSVTFTSATTLVAVSPAHAAGGVDVVVQNPDGQESSLGAAFAFDPIPAPTIGGITPASGPSVGGTQVSISGTGFVSGTRATLGGAAVVSLVVVSATQLTATTPPHAPGAVALVVSNPDGQAATLAAAFTYNAAAAPTLTGVAPSSGPSTGGTVVSLSGSGYTNGTTVSFGGVAATSVQFGSASTLTATTPAHAAGAVDVVVRNADGQTATLGAAFTFTQAAAPAVTGVAPASGSANGGTLVSISGTGFAAGASVSIGGVPASAVAVLDASSMTAVTGAHAPGTGDVVVRNPDGQTGTLPLAYTYEAAPAPAVTSVAPASGPSNGGTRLTINGSGFVPGCSVSIGGVAATDVVVDSAASLAATTAANVPGSADVVVQNPDGQAATLAGAFTYVASPAPSLATVTPDRGPSTGGTTLTLTGQSFVVGAQVRLGGAPCASVFVGTATVLTCVTPAHAPGGVDVEVENPDGQLATAAGAYTYQAAPAPTLDGVVPATGPTTGGTELTLSGTGFAEGAIVRLDGVAATNVVVASSSSISATAPAHAVGSVDVEVENPDGQLATLAGAFTYMASPAPTLAVVMPDSGATNGGTWVTLQGTGFMAGAAVDFGGAAAPEVNVASPTSLTALTPAHAAGVVDVTLINPDAQSATFASSFTYTLAPAPVVLSIEPASGPTAGGTTVTVSGESFAVGATLTVGGVVLNTVIASTTSLTATMPPHDAGAVDLVVTNPDGQSGTLAAAFEYVAPAAPAPQPDEAEAVAIGCGCGASTPASSTLLLGALLLTTLWRRRLQRPSTSTSDDPSHLPTRIRASWCAQCRTCSSGCGMIERGHDDAAA